LHERKLSALKSRKGISLENKLFPVECEKLNLSLICTYEWEMGEMLADVQRSQLRLATESNIRRRERREH